MTRVTFLWLMAGLGAFAHADEAGARKHFDAVKGKTPELISFLDMMPKGADLHVHTSGEIYAEDSLQEAIKLNLNYNPDTGYFQKDSTDKSIPAGKLAQNSAAL